MVEVLSAGSIYGKTLCTTGAFGFQVREAAYLSGLRTPWHRHGYPYFAYTLRGTSRQTYRTGNLQCCPGTLVFHTPEEVHRDAFVAPDVRVLQIEIVSPRVENLQPLLELLPPSKDLTHPLANCTASRLCRELRQMDELSPLAIEGLVLELIAGLVRYAIRRPGRQVSAWLSRAEELIRRRFSEHLTLSAIAKEIGVHPVHLAREFRRHYGCTVGEKLRSLRIEYACREIARSSRPLSEIAFAAGFADQSHFSKTFRHQTGMSPSQFSSEFRPS